MREDYLKKLNALIKNLDKGYQKLFSYFKKNWEKIKFFNFSDNNDEIIKRSNNIC